MLLGSTADFTIHCQAKDGTLEELLPTTSAPFGGTSVNKEFEKFLETIAGKGILESFAREHFESYSNMMNDFEFSNRYSLYTRVRIKITLEFDKYVKKKNGVGLEKALQNSHYRNTVTYKNYTLCFDISEFEKLFRNAIDGIIECVANILTTNEFDDVNYIIMVGGFSNYGIVEKALREKFKTRRFIIPIEPELAGLKGAVYFGHLPNSISRHAARYTYGVQVCPKFRPGEDPENKKIKVNSLELCKDVLYPLVKRGERIAPGCMYSVVCQSIMFNQKKFECGIYVSSCDNPKFVDENGCRLLGKVAVMLPRGESNAVLEETIIFSETDIIFRVKDLNTGRVSETAIDPLK